MATISFAGVGISHANSGNFNEWQSDSNAELNTVQTEAPIILAEAKIATTNDTGPALRLPAEAVSSVSLRPVMRIDDPATLVHSDVQTVASTTPKKSKSTRATIVSSSIFDPVRAHIMIGVYH